MQLRLPQWTQRSRPGTGSRSGRWLGLKYTVPSSLGQKNNERAQSHLTSLTVQLPLAYLPRGHIRGRVEPPVDYGLVTLPQHWFLCSFIQLHHAVKSVSVHDNTIVLPLRTDGGTLNNKASEDKGKQTGRRHLSHVMWVVGKDVCRLSVMYSSVNLQGTTAKRGDLYWLGMIIVDALELRDETVCGYSSNAVSVNLEGRKVCWRVLFWKL